MDHVRSFVTLATLAGCMAGGCSLSEPPVVRQRVARLGPPGACTNSDWVGVAPAGACWNVAAWLGNALPPIGVSGAVPCAYTWTGLGDPAPGDVAALAGAPFLIDLARDCPVVAPMEVISNASGYDRNRAHRARLGLPLPVAARQARLAILDTLPRGTAQPRSTHGPLMVAFAEEVACPTGLGCGLEIRPELALPLDEGGQVDTVRGGFYGRLTHLARAIDEAVQSWQSDPLASNAPLVLSLSLGWKPEGALDDSVPNDHLYDFVTYRAGVAGPVRAVHAAVVRARCAGALVVAAGGNDPTLRQAHGALLPGAWARLGAPRSSDCGSVLGFGKSEGGGSKRRRAKGETIASDTEEAEPLLHAIGGVDLEDKPSRVGRHLGYGPLVAPSDGAALRMASGYVVRSGTSVATARVASLAATVWSLRPSLSPGQVMDVLWASAESVGRSTPLCPGPGGCPAVRRIAPCRSLQSVGVTASCPAVPPGGDTSGASLLQARLAAGPVSGAVASAATPVPAGFLPYLVSTSTCPYPLASAQASPPWPCPADMAPPAQTWPAIAPQPEDPMCPDCMYRVATKELFLSLETGVAVPTSAVLYIKGIQTKAYDLLSLTAPYGGLQPGQVFLLEGLGGGPPVDTAWIEFTVQSGGLTTVRADAVTLLP